MPTYPRQRSYRGYPGQSPQRRIDGTAPYAQPQNNKGANPAAGEIRTGQWHWGSSPETASDEIKGQWAAAKSPGQSTGAGGASATGGAAGPAAPVSGSGAMAGSAAQQLARGARGEGTNGADNRPAMNQQQQGGTQPGRVTPPGRINGAAPYAQPENNKGANPAASEIRDKWGWGSSPDTASDEIKGQWGQMRDAAQGKSSPLYTGPDFTLPVGASGVVPGASNNIPAVEAGKPAEKPYQGNGGTFYA